jgi:hypothetical protein
MKKKQRKVVRPLIALVDLGVCRVRVDKRPRSLNSTRTSRANLAQQTNASRQSRLNAGGNGCRLDSTRMRGPPSAAAATAACQAADDDAEEGDDGVDDCLKTSSDGVDNGHDAVADGAEDGLDAGYDGTHDCGVVVV